MLVDAENQVFLRDLKAVKERPSLGSKQIALAPAVWPAAER